MVADPKRIMMSSVAAAARSRDEGNIVLLVGNKAMEEELKNLEGCKKVASVAVLPEEVEKQTSKELLFIEAEVAEIPSAVLEMMDVKDYKPNDRFIAGSAAPAVATGNSSGAGEKSNLLALAKVVQKSRQERKKKKADKKRKSESVSSISAASRDEKRLKGEASVVMKLEIYKGRVPQTAAMSLNEIFEFVQKIPDSPFRLEGHEKTFILKKMDRKVCLSFFDKIVSSDQFKAAVCELQKLFEIKVLTDEEADRNRIYFQRKRAEEEKAAAGLVSSQDIAECIQIMRDNPDDQLIRALNDVLQTEAKRAAGVVQRGQDVAEAAKRQRQDESESSEDEQ